MDAIVGLILMITGIVVLIKGRLQLSSRSVATGAAARKAGILLICAFPAAFVATLVETIVSASGPDPLADWGVFSFLLSYIVMIVFVVLAFVIAGRGAKTRA